MSHHANSCHDPAHSVWLGFSAVPGDELRIRVWAANAVEFLAQVILTFMANRRMATQPITAVRRVLKRPEVREAFEHAADNREQRLLVTAAAEAEERQPSNPGHAVPVAAKRQPGPGAFSQSTRRRGAKARPGLQQPSADPPKGSKGRGRWQPIPEGGPPIAAPGATVPEEPKTLDGAWVFPGGRWLGLKARNCLQHSLNGNPQLALSFPAGGVLRTDLPQGQTYNEMCLAVTRALSLPPTGLELRDGKFRAIDKPVGL